MRNDKTACNLEPFQASFSKIGKKNEHDTTSLFLQFQLPGVKSAGTGNDRSQFKGLSPIVNVANNPKEPQLVPNASLWCRCCTNRNRNMGEVQ